MPQTKRKAQVEHLAYVQRALRTGQSLAAYARDHHLDVQSLYTARWQQRSRPSGFVRVQVEGAVVAPMPMPMPMPMPVAIRLPNGITISAPMATDLSALVRTLLPL